ncbi:MAG TPA: universal stress protein [Pirellulales bacterium]|nr:universal stress protein [Pirellulales bacterium]
MKVLIGVDGSSGSFGAIRLASRIVSGDDRVALYYTPPEMRHPSSSDADPEVLERARKALADSVFEEARNRLPDALKTSLKTIVGTKPPRQGVLLAAEDWRAELIVLGARGSAPLGDVRLGSVATAVAHTSRIPVLIARTADEPAAHGPFKVLLTHDGSPASQQCAELLGAFHWPPQTVGRSMTVVESLYAGKLPDWLEQQARDAQTEAMAEAWQREHEEEKRRKRAELERCCQSLPTPFRQPPIVAEGYPAEEILRVITDDAVDLVVLGKHGRGMLERLLFLGSTSDKVLSQAPCSVLMVPQRERP